MTTAESLSKMRTNNAKDNFTVSKYLQKYDTTLVLEMKGMFELDVDKFEK